MFNRSFKVWIVPLVLLLLCFLSYGLLIPTLGYYLDDWTVIWVSHSLGPTGLREYFSFDKPFLGWLYTLTTPLLGEAPPRWHLFALLTRWSGAVAIWWGLRGLWPHKTREVACVAFLFAVYPSFSLQPVAISNSHLFIALALIMFSLGAMIWALRKPRLFWPLTILALLSSALSMMLVEYFVGLELVRPALLWAIIAEHTTSNRLRLRRTLANWSPYLAVFGTYVVWSQFLFKPGLRDYDQSVFLANIWANPLSELSRRLRSCFTDLIESSLIVWTETFRPDIFDLGSRSAWVALGIVAVTAIGLTFYLIRLRSDADSEGSDSVGEGARWTKQAIIIGFFAIIVGGIPVWFSGREVTLGTTHDRFSISMMLGACLLLVGLVCTLIRTRLQQVIVLSVIVGLAGGFHFRNANKFRRDWVDQKSLWWQLSWRAPDLQPGTSILIDESPLMLSSHHELSKPLNFIYDPQHSSGRLNYWFFELSPKLSNDQLPRGGDQLPLLAKDLPIDQEYRTLSFAGSTFNSLAVWYSPPSCLRVVDPSRDELPQLPSLARAARSISNIDRIVANASPSARPPSDIFGSDPGPCWCYYFQKADLARQMGDWEKVVQLGDEARKRGFKPEDATEWLPFAEGYTQVGRYQDAREISKLAVEAMPLAQDAFRALWERLGDAGSQDTARISFIAEMKGQISLTTQ